MAKSDPKTMRFEEDVEAYIMKAQGDNFSEKFHNLVYWFKDQENKKKAKIKTLDDEIKSKVERLQKLNNMLSDCYYFEKQFKDLQDSINSAKTYFKKLEKL